MSQIERVIYIISDIHLGGEPEHGKRGFRICTHEVEVASFIHSLSNLTGPAVELVINGDLVDFLAERVSETPPHWSSFHYPEQKAVDVLDRIVGRKAFVFDALRTFQSKGHRLVILPGNHDIELNLPAVRRRLRHHAGADGPADYEFISNGEAYRAGDVLIEHGNRVDEMNFVDYQVLRHLCGLLSRGMPVREEFRFEPPAGSKLVAEVLNDIKKSYSFIDLLKPEGEAAFPIILSLEPGRRRELLVIARALYKGKERRRQQLRQYNSDISAKGDGPSIADSSNLDSNALEAILLRTVGRADFGTPSSDSRCGASAQDISLLNAGGSLISLLMGDKNESWEHRLHDLFDALRAFQRENSFDRSVETEKVYIDEAQDLAYGPVRHVVFGHTHRPKQVKLTGGGYYFNSGTWADILELPPEVLDSTRRYASIGKLEEFIRDLSRNDFSRYVQFHPTYVRIEQDSAGNSVTQKLCDYSND